MLKMTLLTVLPSLRTNNRKGLAATLTVNQKGKEGRPEARAAPVAAYSVRKLSRWQKRLLRRRHKLSKMDTEKRHRLRLLNKKLCYSIESLADLFVARKFSRQQTAQKYLRRAQGSLGQLNDDARGHSLATILEREGAQVPLQFLSRKREKRLIRVAATAHRKLAALE